MGPDRSEKRTRNKPPIHSDVIDRGVTEYIPISDFGFSLVITLGVVPLYPLLGGTSPQARDRVVLSRSGDSGHRPCQVTGVREPEELGGVGPFHPDTGNGDLP